MDLVRSAWLYRANNLLSVIVDPRGLRWITISLSKSEIVNSRFDSIIGLDLCPVRVSLVRK